MLKSGEKLYDFGDFSLDVSDKLLARQGEIVSLPPKLMDVLCLLVIRKGGVVSKSELMDSVWADSFVEESNLTQTIYSLRRILGKSSDNTELIETIPRKGYRVSVPIIEHEQVLGQTTDDKNGTGVESNARKRRHIYLLSFGVVILIAFGALAGYVFSKYAQRSAPIEKVQFQKLTFSGDISFPVISPDGHSFAYVNEGSIHLQDITTGSSFKLNIPDHSRFGNLQFSSEGENIFFRTEDGSDAPGDVYKVSRFGGVAKQIAARVWSTVDVSPDGHFVAFVRSYPKEGEWSLIVRDLATGSEEKIYSCNLPTTIFRSGFPAWSPDGKRLAIVEQTSDQKNQSHLVLVDTNTHRSETIATPRFVQIEQVDWMPDGKRLLVTGRENNRFFQVWALDLNTNEIRPITNDLNIYRSISISADGKSLLARQYSIYSHIWTADAADLERPKQVTFGNLNRDGTSGIVWTNDGRILYSSRITGNVDLWSVRPDDGSRAQLTDDAGANNADPFVTADGKYVYFESTRSGTRHIWRANSDGTEPVQITSSENETDFLPTVSPDGGTIYYIQRNARSNVLFRQSLTDGTREMVTQQGKLAPGAFLSMSPDGRFLAFEVYDDEKKGDTTNIMILDVTNGGESRTVRINSPNAQIIWSTDGRFFDYAENSSTTSKIWRQAAYGSGERILLFELPKSRIYGFAWSKDGKTLAFARGRQESDAILLRGFE